jgi:hypothetical protein
VKKSRADLTSILSRSLGEDGARAHVDRAADGLGLGDALGIGDALRVLEQLADEPGNVGISARFAKARVHLAWDDQRR